MTDVNTTIQTILLLLAIGGTIGGVIWKLTRVENDLAEKITSAKEEVEEKQNQLIREFSETVAAMRQKISDLELYIARNYVGSEAYRLSQDDLRKDFRILSDKIDVRFERLESKIDTKT